MDNDTLIGAFWVCGIITIICFSVGFGIWISPVLGIFVCGTGMIVIIPSSMIFAKWVNINN